MRRPAVILIRVGYVAVLVLLALMVYPALRRAKGRSGPTPRAIIYSQLGTIDDAKKALKEGHSLPDDYWPTRAEIAAAHTGKTNYSFDALVKPSRWGEVYIVNRLGAPALALLTNAVGGFPEGRLLTAADLRPGAQPDPPANQSQPVRSETNQTSAAAGSRRSP